MRPIGEIFDDVLRAYVKEAMDQIVGNCADHGGFTRAQDHIFGGCPECWKWFHEKPVK